MQATATVCTIQICLISENARNQDVQRRNSGFIQIRQILQATNWRQDLGLCTVTLRAASWTTVSWSPMYAPENCVLLTLERSLSTGPAAVSATGRSLLLRLEYGTVCRPTWENRNCHTASSGGLWRHFYSDSETTAHCELLNCAA